MGLFAYIGIIFILQIVVIATIIFFLKKRLDKQLVELAVQKFGMLSPENVGPEQKDVLVITFRKLSEEIRGKLLGMGQKRLNRMLNLIVKEDKAIKGGMVIKFKDFSIDYSLASRLKESGLMGRIFH